MVSKTYGDIYLVKHMQNVLLHNKAYKHNLFTKLTVHTIPKLFYHNVHANNTHLQISHTQFLV